MAWAIRRKGVWLGSIAVCSFLGYNYEPFNCICSPNNVGWIGLIHRPSDIFKPISLDITYSHSKSDLAQTEKEEKLPVKTAEPQEPSSHPGSAPFLNLTEHLFGAAIVFWAKRMYNIDCPVNLWGILSFGSQFKFYAGFMDGGVSVLAQMTRELCSQTMQKPLTTGFYPMATAFPF